MKLKVMSLIGRKDNTIKIIQSDKYKVVKIWKDASTFNDDLQGLSLMVIGNNDGSKHGMAIAAIKIDEELNQEFVQRELNENVLLKMIKGA